MIVALVGGVAAALAPLYDRLLLVAGACAIALLAAPTLSGHALDRDQTELDLGPRRSRAHRVGGGLARRAASRSSSSLPRASADAAERSRVVRRFSTVALASVVVLALAGSAAR